VLEIGTQKEFEEEEDAGCESMKIQIEIWLLADYV